MRIPLSCALVLATSACTGASEAPTPTPVRTTTPPATAPNAPPATAPTTPPATAPNAPTPPKPAAPGVSASTIALGLPEGVSPTCIKMQDDDLLVVSSGQNPRLFRVSPQGTTEVAPLPGLMKWPAGCEVVDGALLIWGQGAELVRIDPTTGSLTKLRMKRDWKGYNELISVQPYAGGMLLLYNDGVVASRSANGAVKRLGGNEPLYLDSVSGPPGDTALGALYDPSSMVVLGEEAIVVDRLGYIFAIPLAGGEPTKLAGGRGMGHVDGIGDAARLTSPGDAALLGDRVVFVEGGCIRAFDRASRGVTTLVGDCEAGLELGDGTRIEHLGDLTVSGDHEVLVQSTAGVARIRLP